MDVDPTIDSSLLSMILLASYIIAEIKHLPI